jgi:nicotinamide mononucleotide adenylyltransferase
MTIEEREAWTRRVVTLPQHVAHSMLVQQLLKTGDAMLIAIKSPQNAREWEFNARVETLKAAVEHFVHTKVTPVCPVKLV